MKYQRIELYVSRLLLLGSLVYILLEWNQMPNIIPSHFNVIGEIDHYDEKSSIFMIFICMLVVHICFITLEKNIENWKVSILVRVQKNTPIYRMIYMMLTIIHLICMISMLILIVYSIRGSNLPNLFPMLMILGILVPVCVIVIKLLWESWKEYHKYEDM